MIYITGDIHGDERRITRFAREYAVTSDDVIVLLGDVGANYSCDWRDRRVKSHLDAIGCPVFCIHGNHEQRPQNIPSYRTKVWRGGEVFYQQDYPNVLFAKDGEVFDLAGHKVLVIGGAYSVDKFYRLERGYNWWPDEQPDADTKALVEWALRNVHGIDVIFSHTCPWKYRPVEAFLPGLDQSTVDESTELWLGQLENGLDYRAWYCGHWHITKRVDRIHFLFNEWEVLDEGQADRPAGQEV